MSAKELLMPWSALGGLTHIIPRCRLVDMLRLPAAVVARQRRGIFENLERIKTGSSDTVKREVCDGCQYAAACFDAEREEASKAEVRRLAVRIQSRPTTTPRTIRSGNSQHQQTRKRDDQC